MGWIRPTWIQSKVRIGWVGYGFADWVSQSSQDADPGEQACDGCDRDLGGAGSGSTPDQTQPGAE
jgi:hypothetical protein